MFNDHELELLISGLPEIDVDDLRGNTEYTGYTPAARQIQWFWEIVAALSKEDLALLVQFVTGTSKVPLEGFKALQVSHSTGCEPEQMLVGCVVCKCSQGILQAAFKHSQFCLLSEKPGRACIA